MHILGETLWLEKTSALIHNGGGSSWGTLEYQTCGCSSEAFVVLRTQRYSLAGKCPNTLMKVATQEAAQIQGIGGQAVRDWVKKRTLSGAMEFYPGSRRLVIDLPENIVESNRVAARPPVLGPIPCEAPADLQAGDSSRRAQAAQDGTLLQHIAELCQQISEQNRLTHQTVARQIDDQIQSVKAQQSVQKSLDLLLTPHTTRSGARPSQRIEGSAQVPPCFRHISGHLFGQEPNRRRIHHLTTAGLTFHGRPRTTDPDLESRSS